MDFILYDIVFAFIMHNSMDSQPSLSTKMTSSANCLYADIPETLFFLVLKGGGVGGNINMVVRNYSI